MASFKVTTNGPELVLGSRASVISRHGIRYEGILYFLNAQESTLGLRNATNYGTEGRRDGMQVPPSDTVYEFLQFHFRDIVELHLYNAPPTQLEEQDSNSSTNAQRQHLTRDSNELCLNDVNKNRKKDEPRGCLRKTMMDSAADNILTSDSEAENKKLGATPCYSHNHKDRNEHDRFNKRMKLNPEVSFS